MLYLQLSHTLFILDDASKAFSHWGISLISFDNVCMPQFCLLPTNCKPLHSLPCRSVLVVDKVDRPFSNHLVVLAVLFSGAYSRLHRSITGQRNRHLGHRIRHVSWGWLPTQWCLIYYEVNCTQNFSRFLLSGVKWPVYLITLALLTRLIDPRNST